MLYLKKQKANNTPTQQNKTTPRSNTCSWLMASVGPLDWRSLSLKKWNQGIACPSCWVCVCTEEIEAVWVQNHPKAWSPSRNIGCVTWGVHFSRGTCKEEKSVVKWQHLLVISMEKWLLLSSEFFFPPFLVHRFCMRVSEATSLSVNSFYQQQLPELLKNALFVFYRITHK